MGYLLDTNTCIRAMRGVTSVVDALATHSPKDLSVSAITAYEMQTGAEKCVDPSREGAKVDKFLNAIHVNAFDRPAAMSAAKIRANLESRGEMIGPYDVLLAGHARSLGLILVTDNTKEFRRVPGLTMENWNQ
jgi:tRNA(fMet)-specific endonuclease VapC